LRQGEKNSFYEQWGEDRKIASMNNGATREKIASMNSEVRGGGVGAFCWSL